MTEDLEDYRTLVKALTTCARTLNRVAMDANDPFIKGIAVAASNSMTALAEVVSKPLRDLTDP